MLVIVWIELKVGMPLQIGGAHGQVLVCDMDGHES